MGPPIVSAEEAKFQYFGFVYIQELYQFELTSTIKPGHCLLAFSFKLFLLAELVLWIIQ